MKHYEEPILDLIPFSVEDIVTASSPTYQDGVGGDGNVGGEMFG